MRMSSLVLLGVGMAFATPAFAASTALPGDTQSTGPEGAGNFVAGKPEGNGNFVTGKPEGNGNSVNGKSEGMGRSVAPARSSTPVPGQAR
jgi:hypothetical protein